MTPTLTTSQESSDARRVRMVLTLALVVVITIVSLVFQAKDGGNLDFYRRPMIVGWLLVTIGSAIFPRRSKVADFLATAWWLQLFVPLTIVAVAMMCVGIYEPYRF